MGEAAGQCPDFTPWLQAANLIERRLHRISRIEHGALLVILEVMIISWTLGEGKSIWVFLGYNAVGAILVGAIFGLNRWMDSRTGSATMARDGQLKDIESLAYQARDAQVLERMAGGAITGNELYEHTPWPYNLLVRPRENPTPLEVLERVVFSLEWYTGPSRRHFRRDWLFGTIVGLYAVVGLAALVFPSTARTWSIFKNYGFMLFIFIPQLTTQANIACNLIIGGLEQRIEDQTDASGTCTDAITEPVQVNPGLLPVLNQLEQDLSNPQRQFLHPYVLLVMFAGVMVTPAGMVASPFGLGAMLYLDFPFMVLCVLLAVIVPDLAKSGSLLAPYRLQVRRRLEESDVALMLAMDDGSTTPAALDPPWPLAWLMHLPRPPRAYADSLRRKVWLAAFNLDWILDTPARQVRACWVMLPLQAACLIMMATSGFMFTPLYYGGSGSELTAYWVISIGTAAAFLLLSLPGLLYVMRTRIWSDELMQHLRRRLAQ